MEERRRELHSGIDEAGYGPLLGPLVVARADFSLTTGRTMPRSAGSGLIDDSKKIMSRHGPARLEAAVLAMQSIALGRHARSLSEWLEQDPDLDRRRHIASLPWYCGADPHLPHFATADDVAAAYEELEREPDYGRGRFDGFRLAVLSESAYNRAVTSTGNKHDSLFVVVAELLGERLASPDVRHIVVDKLGGRSRYAARLSGFLPFVALDVVEESPGLSRYALELPSGTAFLDFRKGGDAASPMVGLASMAAKYTRELLMSLFNRYWTSRYPRLEPTAGYWVDGQRFVSDLRATGSVRDDDLEAMIRSR